MIFALVPATVFADDTTLTIYIEGNELTETVALKAPDMEYL